MSYFKHKSLIIEAFQFLPDEYLKKGTFLDSWTKTPKGPIVGTINNGKDDIFVYPTDWVLYGNNSKRFVITDDAFHEFLESVG